MTVAAVYTAKANMDRAVKYKQDSGPFVESLAEARSAERLSVAALDKHREEHGC
jgi:hypothetical protein